MRTYLSRILIIICLFSLFSLNLLFVYAEQDENVVSEETVSSVTEEDSDYTNEMEESDDDIYTEETTTEPVGQVQQSSVDSMDITSVKNINGLPEANLELNNILNIILIAIGVLLILLAIALLIRIGKK